MHLTVEVTGPQAENWSSGAGYGQRMVVAVERRRVVDTRAVEEGLCSLGKRHWVRLVMKSNPKKKD